MRHLAAAAETADRLGEGDLTARVPDEGPSEVRRVGAALNRLAGRIDELLAAERETVADLSHRLRTPLTAVRLDVESLPRVRAQGRARGAPRPASSAPSRPSSMRLGARSARVPSRICDAAAVVARAAFEFWAPLAEDQGREASLDIARTGAVTVRCAAADLRSALDALLENAVAHTPEGTAIAVVLTSGDVGTVRLDVRDRGPGVRRHAVRRGSSDRGSTGLGLDIARTCAEASGGRLELVHQGGWSVVRLVLGRSAQVTDSTI